ncbi:MAG TPA: tRNA (adenosine(37)-N6)-threonylcarbamoyltransferase complex dimerization subunit type 1 TsaB, partial [Solibacterales bacterium]|nr:tRNA (adenosine(37)-N6)-threonylcarbamoyltransferase complex dimerization subunit type 1 TsaB [Bryobacterales bacterium]
MSELVLALDTTREAGSLALTEGERTVREMELRAPDGFGQVLFQGIQELLDSANVKLQDCAVFAAASGPGSFTGVRIG